MWLDKLERKFRRFSVPRLMLYIVIGCLLVYVFDVLLVLKGGQTTLSSMLYFNRDLILKGQIWRLITFILIPPQSSMFFVLVALYFYYFIGLELEGAWGSSKFTIYYLFGIIGSIIAGLIAKETTSVYLNLSLFFAYAALFPQRQILLFFVIPIKVKWLGILDGIFFFYSIIISLMLGYWADALAAVMAILNFFIFFGPSFTKDLKQKLKYQKSKREFRKKANSFSMK